MALPNDLLDLLACPEQRSPLSLAPESLVSTINASIRAGTVKNRKGDTLSVELTGALIRGEQDLIYPIVEDIPLLLVEEGIYLSQVTI